jgi:hypothetical protein
MFSVKIVTIDWLIDCFKQEKYVNEKIYKIDMTKDNNNFSKNELNRKRYITYTNKKKLFNGITFAIDEESFGKNKNEMIGRMKRLIMENGGILVKLKDKSHYLV